LFLNDRVKFLTSSILKKISKNNFLKNIILFLKKKNKSWGKNVKTNKKKIKILGQRKKRRSKSWEKKTK
jgi:hypothetical protein